MKWLYKEIVWLLWVLFMAANFDSYSVCNAIICVWESGKLRHYDYFLITVFFCKKQKRNVSEKIRVFLQFSAENILPLFENRSWKARADQNNVKFVFCMKNWFLSFIASLRIDNFNLLSTVISLCSWNVCFLSFEFFHPISNLRCLL